MVEAPDIAAEGQIKCPCGFFQMGMQGPSYASTRMKCPVCGQVLEVWASPVKKEEEP